ncbi:unnamed protein product [Ectocarpus sp. 6 AP-2014]
MVSKGMITSGVSKQEEREPEETCSIGGACPPRKDTLEFHLRPYRIPMDTLRVKHSAVLDLVTTLLGVTPRCDQYLELWPPGFETYNVMVPNLFDIPFCDFGVGTLTPDLRSIPAYVSSRTYGCAYCASHTAVMGTVWKGSGLTLDKNAMAMDAEPSPDVFSRKELAAINIAKKVGAVPSTVTTADIEMLATTFTPKEQEAVVNACTIMGFLNRFMDASGMTLEMEAIETSLQKLAPSGWAPNVAYDKDADAELMKEDRMEAAKREKRKKGSGFFGFVKMIFGGKMADNRSLKKIPTSDAALFSQCKKDGGFVPYYIRQMQHATAKKALSFGFLLRLCQGSDEVPVQLKQLMAYQCATNAENNVLRAHFAFMAMRSGVTLSRLIQVTDLTSTGGGENAAEDAAMAFAQAASWTPTRMTAALAGLISRLFSPPAVIELLITVSVEFAIHRWTSVYVPRRYEPQIDEFVKEYGPALGIPHSPCTADQQMWEEIAAQKRKQ